MSIVLPLRSTSITFYQMSSYSCRLFFGRRKNYVKFYDRFRAVSFSTRKIDLNLEYLTDPKNLVEIERNIHSRKGVGCISKVVELHDQYKSTLPDQDKTPIWDQLQEEALKIPNQSDPRIYSYGDEPHIVERRGNKPIHSFPPLQLHQITQQLGLLRTDNLGLLTGHRSYYLINELALLEQALIQYTVEMLMKKGFELFSVPDLLHRNLIESCGMETRGERTQVYCLDTRNAEDVCLSGTAEMALASYFSDKLVPVGECPKKVAAVSRCYRAETSNVQEERGIYRVHHFTKVEMFGITAGDVSASDELLAHFVAIQRELFDSLDLHYQVLDMPPHELGAPAYRKFDVEAWMAGRAIYGEISSASNCTDYQARRLGIRTIDPTGQLVSYAHTVNGTACAVPRMLIALLETNQLPDGQVVIPTVLRPYCNGLDRLGNREPSFKLRWIKTKARQSKI